MDRTFCPFWVFIHPFLEFNFILISIMFSNVVSYVPIRFLHTFTYLKEFLFYFTLGHAFSYEGPSFGAFEHFAYNFYSFYAGPLWFIIVAPRFVSRDIRPYISSNLFDISLKLFY